MNLNHLKKTTISVLIFVLLSSHFMLFAVAADNTKTALPLSAGVEALRDQFELDVADECNGYALDYAYYSPVGENDSEKYPIVIYLHGIGHGSYVGSQLDDSMMAYWASQEMQAKWKDTGGAFILLPRCPEDKLRYWSESFVDPLRTLIDGFISKHHANVDTTRIFIGGSSAGGEMTWDMAIAYPEYFAGIYPLAATGTRTADNIETTKDVAIWLFASTLDPIISYPLNVLPTWNNICKYNANPQNCRLSKFGIVLDPDGSKGDSNHRLYTTICYDFFTIDGEPYPNVTTTDGNGNTVVFENEEGMISWMSNIHSSFLVSETDDAFSVNVLTKTFIFIRNIFFKIANLFQKLFGYV